MFRLVITACVMVAVIPFQAVSSMEGTAVPALHSPFKEIDRSRFLFLERRVFSRFGVRRITPIKGHLHAGIDLKGRFSEKVYAVAPGRVVRTYWTFPNLAVAISHKLDNGSLLYSAYVHLADVQVKEGDQVDETTVVGRIFDRKEMGLSGFSVPHLHFEIRRDLTEECRTSFMSMTRPALEQHLIDPLVFFRQHMR